MAKTAQKGRNYSISACLPREECGRSASSSRCGRVYLAALIAMSNSLNIRLSDICDTLNRISPAAE